MFRAKVVQKFKTWILRSITYPENRAAYKITWEKYETPPGHRGQYSTCAFYAGWLRLQTHTHNVNTYCS